MSFAVLSCFLCFCFVTEAIKVDRSACSYTFLFHNQKKEKNVYYTVNSSEKKASLTWPSSFIRKSRTVGRSQSRESFSVKSIPLSKEIVNSYYFFFYLFFFLKCSLGEGLQACPIGAFQSCRSLQIQCYKDKIAAKRAELSRMIQDWHRPAELTFLRASSGDSWLMPSEAKEMELNIFILQFDQKAEKQAPGVI